MKRLNNDRILVELNVGELLCGDIYSMKNENSKLESIEVDIDEETNELFDSKNSLVSQFWEENGAIYIATKTKGHKRKIKIAKGLFNKFSIDIQKPAKGGGAFSLQIDDSLYSGAILSGQLIEIDNNDFEMRLEKMEKEILPKILTLFNGEITKKTIGFNV